jgi:MFS family permease
MRDLQHSQEQSGEARRGGPLGALRHRDFRLLWLGSMIAHTGGWMQQVAQAWLIYDLTGSALLVGVNGLVRTLPFLGMSLYAGTVVDRVDRRKLYFWAECAQLLIVLGLASLIATGLVQIWHIYLVSVLNSLVGAFEGPSQQALLPHLVPRQDLMTAVSLNSLLRKGTQIIGPSLGGISVATVGVASTYFLNAGAYVVLILMIFLMRTTNPPVDEHAANPLRAIADGLRYVRSDGIIGTLLLMDSVMSIFGSYNAMLVVFARDVFEVGPQGLGLLQSAPGIGTVLGSMALSSIGNIQHKGRLIIAGGVLYAFSVICFAISPWFPLALFFLTLAGAADITVGSTRTTVLQLFARRNMLGRVMSLQSIATRGISPLSGFQAGALGSVIGVPAAVAMGAAVCLLTVLGVAYGVPELRDFTGEDRREETEASTGATLLERKV